MGHRGGGEIMIDRLTTLGHLAASIGAILFSARYMVWLIVGRPYSKYDAAQRWLIYACLCTLAVWVLRG